MPDTTDLELKTAVGTLHRVTAEVKGFAEKANAEIKRLGVQGERFEKQMEGFGKLRADLTDLQQKMARRPGASGGDFMGEYHHGASWGESFTKSGQFGELTEQFQKGKKLTTEKVEVKTITSAAGSGASLVPSDKRTDPVNLPQRPLTIRDLCAPGETSSNTVYYARQTGRTNAAATVAEDPSAIKPESTYAWEEVKAEVQTIAHFVVLSAQVLADAPGLASTIDTELRYGLVELEERQLLMGDGSGTNLLGIVPQATQFDTTLFAQLNVQSPTPIDTLLLAIAQAETANLPATGIVLHPMDWASIWVRKDAQARYLTGGPGADALQRFWSIPRVTTTVMPRGQFLVGAFRDSAQIFDRSPPTVQASTEDRDNFVRNKVTVLAEERLAFTVRRRAGFITGSLTPPA